MADVGARVVHDGLHSLRVQALRVGTRARGNTADTLSKYANTILLNSTSLFGGRRQGYLLRMGLSVHGGQVCPG